MAKFDDILGGPKTKSHAHPNSGLLVILKRIRGLTQKGMLRHSYHFQIAPLEEFGWDSAYNWMDYDTIERGQFTRDGGRQLKTISLSSMVVDWNPTWAVYVGGRKHHPASQSNGAGATPSWPGPESTPSPAAPPRTCARSPTTSTG